MKNLDKHLPRSKSSIFLIGGCVLALLALLLLNFLPQAEKHRIPVAIISMATLCAYIAEKVAQFANGVILRWGPIASHRLKPFLFYALIWIVAAYFSWEGLFSSDKADNVYRIVLDAVVVYMFAGGLFEILNLLKRGGEK